RFLSHYKIACAYGSALNYSFERLLLLIDQLDDSVRTIDVLQQERTAVLLSILWHKLDDPIMPAFRFSLLDFSDRDAFHFDVLFRPEWSGQTEKDCSIGQGVEFAAQNVGGSFE